MGHSSDYRDDRSGDANGDGWMSTLPCDPPTVPLVPVRHGPQRWHFSTMGYTAYYFEERDNPAAAGGTQYCQCVHGDGRPDKWYAHFYSG